MTPEELNDLAQRYFQDPHGPVALELKEHLDTVETAGVIDDEYLIRVFEAQYGPIDRTILSEEANQKGATPPSRPLDISPGKANETDEATPGQRSSGTREKSEKARKT